MTSFLIVTHKLTNEVLKYSQQTFSWASLFSVRLLCSPPHTRTHINTYAQKLLLLNLVTGSWRRVKIKVSLFLHYTFS